MYHSKYLAPNLEAYTDDDTGLTWYPDGSVVDIFGARFYPDNDGLFDAVTFDQAIAEAVAKDI